MIVINRTTEWFVIKEAVKMLIIYFQQHPNEYFKEIEVKYMEHNLEKVEDCFTARREVISNYLGFDFVINSDKVEVKHKIQTLTKKDYYNIYKELIKHQNNG